MFGMPDARVSRANRGFQLSRLTAVPKSGNGLFRASRRQLQLLLGSGWLTLGLLAQACGGSSGSAVIACVDGGTCPEGLECIASICQLPCANNEDCPDNTFCEASSGACRSGCRDDTDCSLAGYVCRAGACLDGQADLDGDGFPALTDCDDRDPLVNPAATEVCNGIDDNCNSHVDEALPLGELSEKQEGVCAGARLACGGKDGWVEPDYALHDSRYEATEATCDGVDNDCDGSVDEGLVPPAADKATGVCTGAQRTCAGLLGWQEPDYYAIAGYEYYETGDCDGIDSNCDGVVDEHMDGDGDGYYSAGSAACVALYGPQNLIDCDDQRAEYGERCVIHVKASASGLNDGTSWQHAFTSLRDALSVAVKGYEVWIASGTYKPDQGVGATPGSRSATFQLKADVPLYGGFTGTETSLSGRNFRTNKTTLSGDLLGDDAPGFTNRTDNSEHVVMGESGAVLDGLWIVGGQASTDGGGLYNAGPSDTVTIRDCTFADNHASGKGGAIYSYWSSGPTVVNSVFVNNRASSGGAIAGYWSSQPTVYGCLFVGNQAVTSGGAIADDWNNTAKIVNSTFASNSATSGGALFLSYNADATITNSVFWANGAAAISGGSSAITYTCLAEGAVGTGNTTLTQSPFVDLDGADNVAGNMDDNLELAAGSSCIDSGNNAAVPAELSVDLAGRPRIARTVDGGAYEKP